ncbi:MAG: hypothetical protein ABEK59_08225 [Halobacteria archaeon]
MESKTTTRKIRNMRLGNDVRVVTDDEGTGETEVGLERQIGNGRPGRKTEKRRNSGFIDTVVEKVK